MRLRNIILSLTVVAAMARADDLVRYPASFFAAMHPNTALDMVEHLPGFTFSAGDSTVRGFAGAAGNVLVDGSRPADKQFTLDQVLARIPADDVDHIEIIHGSAPGIEMLGQSVVANVVRKKKAPDTLSMTLSDAHLADGRDTPSAMIEATRHLDGGRTLSGAVYLGRYAEASEGDGIRTRSDAAGAPLSFAQVESSAGGLTGFAYALFETPAWAGKLRLNANVAWTDYTNEEIDRQTFPVPSVTALHEKLGGIFGGQGNAELGLSFSRSFGRRITSESVALLRLSHQSYASSLTSPGADTEFAEHDSSGEALARSDVHYTFDKSLVAELSLEGAYNWLDTVSAVSFDTFPVSLPNARAAVSELRGEASTQLSWTPAAWLQVELGLRTEVSAIAARSDSRHSQSLFYPKPRLSVIATLTPSDQLRLRIEREVGQLDFTNFVAASALDTGTVHAGNTNIVPQQDWVFEAAYERRLGSGSDAVLTWRHLLISDAIDRVPVRDPANPAAVFDAPGNIGGGFGEALLANATVALDPLGLAHAQIKGSATLQWSHVTDPTTGAKRAISDEKPQEFSAEFRQDVPALRASFGVTYATACGVKATAKACTASDYRFNEIDVYRATGSLGLYGEYTTPSGIWIRLEADNLLGERFRRLSDIFAGPRDSFPIAYVDDRLLKVGPSFSLQLRKSF